ncbi:MAG: glycoside hydrolase family 43 protein [Bifidobacterium scardovii]|uniref:glycoside hydrolase family 43 protein n=1 Tax=Bifidobacterium scardovii TaxID=158787 RepID=UPI002901C24F|nr:glycoside hydrolase family 43 protein [Bifidobacterium scardovii]MDU2420643.1 glycoside hydrolase family 43 protein [Bifidobacterium scardovii]
MNGTAPIINPVLHGFHPDPSWMWHDGKAWLVTSSFGLVPGLPIYTSADLAHWDYAGAAIDATVADRLFLGYIASDERGVFAPSIRALGGAIVIVSTVVSIDSRRALADGADPDAIAAMERANGNFALVSHDGGATWDGPYWVDGATGNDPDLFIDEDGTAWWVGSHQSANPRWPYQSDIYMRRLDLDRWTLNGPEHVLWHGAMEGATWAESPHIVRKDGWYYLFAAEAGTERRHAQSAARSKSPIGPYQGDPCNPILTHRHLGGRYPVQNIGHCDVLRDDDGQWWGVCLGSRVIDGYSFMGREPFVFPVTWEDDWPVLAPGDGLVPRIVATDGNRASAGRTGEHAGTAGSARSDATIDPGDTPDAAAHDDSSVDRPASWRSVAIGADHALHTPLQPDWSWAKVTETDFSVFTLPESTGEIRIQQNQGVYAALHFDADTRTAEGVIRNGGDRSVLWRRPIEDGKAYTIRLNGTRLEFRDEPASAGAADAQPTTTAEPPLRVRIGDAPHAGIAAGGYPLHRVNPCVPPSSRLIAQCDAAFLSTERAGGYLGCLAGIRPR